MEIVHASLFSLCVAPLHTPGSIYYLQLEMSHPLGKAKQKAKKAGDFLDRLRPRLDTSRPTSPTPSHQDGQLNRSVSKPDPSTAATRITHQQPSVQPTLLLIPPSSPASPATTTADPKFTSLPLAAASIPAYAMAPSAPSTLATTGSAIKGLLVATRDGSFHSRPHSSVLSHSGTSGMCVCYYTEIFLAQAIYSAPPRQRLSL